MAEEDRILAAIRRLTAAANKIDGAYYFRAKGLGIKENTLALLYVLDDGLPHTQKEIAETWLIPKTTINTAVKELMSAGYVTLAPASHTREKTIVLTEAGRAYTGRIVGPIAAAERQALEETLGRYAMDFIDAYDHFAQALCRALELKNSPGDHDERIV